MKALYIAWQDWQTRSWYTVGKLIKEQDAYCFTYTQGSLISPRFTPFGIMSDLHKKYYSRDLFPLFANRILNDSRPEYQDYLRWLALDNSQNDDMQLLARSGGRRATDELYVYPHPEPNEQGETELFFLSHGMRHLSHEQIERVNQLKQGELLRLNREANNDYDSFALLLETKERIKAGYCPRYLNKDLIKVMDKTTVDVTVARLNTDAPINFRLLCRAVFTLPKHLDLFATNEHQVLSSNKIAA